MDKRVDRKAGIIAELQDGRYNHGEYRFFTAADFDHPLKSGMHCDVVSNACASQSCQIPLLQVHRRASCEVISET